MHAFTWLSRTSLLTVYFPPCPLLADITAGRGMYHNAASKTYWATNCDSSSYGVKNTTYGLSAHPCNDCPSGMYTEASLALTAPYTARDTPGDLLGFANPLACVTNKAFGFDGRIASR